jgi:CheY-like chemotaxis protein
VRASENEREIMAEVQAGLAVGPTVQELRDSCGFLDPRPAKRSSPGGWWVTLMLRLLLQEEGLIVLVSPSHDRVCAWTANLYGLSARPTRRRSHPRRAYRGMARSTLWRREQMETARGLVLVVDDDANVQQLIADALGDEGYRVLPSVDGDSLRVALAEQPQLILLDVMMPHMDGVAVSQWLERDPATAHIPVVAMSALGREGAPEGLVVDDWLPKPFDLDDLYRLVAAWVRASDAG